MPFLGHSWIMLVIILVIVLVVIGPGKLSNLGDALGRSVRDFRKATQDPSGEKPESKPSGPE